MHRGYRGGMLYRLKNGFYCFMSRSTLWNELSWRVFSRVSLPFRWIGSSRKEIYLSVTCREKIKRQVLNIFEMDIKMVRCDYFCRFFSVSGRNLHAETGILFFKEGKNGWCPKRQRGAFIEAMSILEIHQISFL